MKKYERLSMEVVELNAKDALTTSGEVTGPNGMTYADCATLDPKNFPTNSGEYSQAYSWCVGQAFKRGEKFPK